MATYGETILVAPVSFPRSAKWTNPSVLKLAGDSDPLEAVTRAARRIVLEALDAGWTGPPFDPLVLAEKLSIEVLPNADVREARTVSAGRGKLRIEFNPTRPRGRLRYSIAHEISHTLFSDCAERVRHRGGHEGLSADDWQLETLCNVAAAEILMPFGSLPQLRTEALDVNNLMELRSQFDVSTEALFIRAARLTVEPCVMFASSRIEQGTRQGEYRIDYAIPSQSWNDVVVARGATLSSTSVLSECSAIGYTAKRDEELSGKTVHVECVGIPSFPGSTHPRVVGIVSRKHPTTNTDLRIVYLRGSATEPRGDAPKIVAHVVNDKTPNWGGGGFAQAVRRRWEPAQKDFQTWAAQSRRNLVLGAVRICDLEDGVAVASLVAQKGYGDSGAPRIRYGALTTCLSKLASEASQLNATVHMPRIGCGQAGGHWEVVEELVDSTLGAAGVRVFVYDLPNAEPAKPVEQQFLSFKRPS